MDIKDCANCLYRNCDENEFPCSKCYNLNKWKYLKSSEFKGQTPEQPTIPPTPPVKPPKEEINHPDRYAGGKYECIDIMLDVFGKDAVMHFCILNAFKYLWRAEKKNGVQDVQKAVWYLNKYIELVESEGKE